jgi:Leucine-rich repeat (LRR) protein
MCDAKVWALSIFCRPVPSPLALRFATFSSLHGVWFRSQVENLERLTKLERLWLCNNALPRIEGLETLTNLTELNLARNKIERVGVTHIPPN